MNIIDIITKKKNKSELSYDELSFAFNGYLKKDVADYQMSSLLMAITINGLNLRETIDLTDIFIKSGEIYEFKKKVADKHSTGGVGDTTTLIVGPIVASLGIPIAKMSGRGLGITGGTADKLESIPGFKLVLSKKEFIDQVNTVGIAQCTQSDDIVPLDKIIYALRDVSGTTECLGLIASSIMSKKIACGGTYIVLDIKVGPGALIKTVKEAQTFADWCIKIGEHYKRKVKTIISPMSSPLASSIGNALEVLEAIEVLKGKTGNLRTASVELAANIIALAKNIKVADAIILAENCLKQGLAYQMFEKWIHAQGGDLTGIKVSDKILNIHSSTNGRIESISAENCGKLSLKLGAGRLTKDAKIDYSVGIKLLCHEGQTVKKGDVLAELYVSDYKISLTPADLKLFVIK